MADILGIKLSDQNASEALETIMSFLDDGRQHYVVTPNPEIILAAGKDEELFYILDKADLSLADGFGLKVAGLMTGQKIERVTGSDLSLKLLERAAQAGRRVMVLDWKDGLSKAADIEAAVAAKFPNLKFSALDIEKEKFLSKEELAAINGQEPEILFNTLGIGWQEKLMYHNLPLLPSVRVALGVGGTFDFLTGKARRAPELMRRFGLEWLFRLYVSGGKGKKRRWDRIYRAVFVFTAKVFKAYFINSHRYRQNVAIMAYKLDAAGQPEFLLAEREDEPGHWQLPQGGTDGEDLATAGRREAREELGIEVEPVATFPDVYRYEFSTRYPGSLPNIRRNFQYKGQNQGLLIAYFSGPDSDIRLNFWDHRAWKWVPETELLEVIHPIRKAATDSFLKKFQSLDPKIIYRQEEENNDNQTEKI